MLGLWSGTSGPLQMTLHFAFRATRVAVLGSWEQDGTWETGPIEKPLGRGLNFQIIVGDVQALYEKILASGHEPFVAIYTKEYWRRDQMDTRTEFAIQDPDGYLLRFTQIVSDRPITQADLDALRGAH